MGKRKPTKPDDGPCIANGAGYSPQEARSMRQFFQQFPPPTERERMRHFEDLREWLTQRLDEQRQPEWLLKNTCFNDDLKAIIDTRWRDVLVLLLRRIPVASFQDSTTIYVEPWEETLHDTNVRAVKIKPIRRKRS